MEPLFENSFVYDNKNALEITRGMRRLVVTNIVLLCFVAVMIIPCVILKLFEIVVLCVIALIFDLFMLEVAPRLSVRQMHKRNMMLFGTDLSVVNKFYDDRIVCTSPESGATNTIGYDQCKRVKRTENFMIIWANASLCIPVYDRGFTKGSPAGLHDFIADKLAQNKKTK